jgi:SAM-dependent methyltransferase
VVAAVGGCVLVVHRAAFGRSVSRLGTRPARKPTPLDHYMSDQTASPVVKDLGLYDTISSTYVSTRRADPRIAETIHAALGATRTVINIGAGTGNYEPTGRLVVAVEPSVEMITRRAADSPRVVRGAAEDLPFPAATFDAAMAVLTLHHWRDWRRGLSEMRRVAHRQVIFLFEPAMINQFWAMEGGYWPEALLLPSERDAIGAEEVGTVLDLIDVETVPVPNDCTDGFGAAFWGRPEAYLDPQVQQGMSWLAQLSPEDRARGAARLETELRSGSGTAATGIFANSINSTSVIALSPLRPDLTGLPKRERQAPLIASLAPVRGCR